ncbi:MAG: DUF58 domain-containing protein, partial [Chloroflexi bacterium]|nr:DUF58 domain-containing protein [Chloroflexota bacterium]
RLPWWRHPVWTVLAFVGFLLLYIFPMRFFIISEGDWFGWLIVGFQAVVAIVYLIQIHENRMVYLINRAVQQVKATESSPSHSHLSWRSLIAAVTVWRSVLPTPRLLYLALLLAPLWAVADAWLLPDRLLWGLLAGIGLLVVADVWLGARPSHFSCERRHESRFSLGADNRIEIIIHNHTARPQLVQLRDDYPAEWSMVVERPILERNLLADTTQSVIYHLRPPRRGNYMFGDMVLRWPGRLGLIQRQVTFSAQTRVKVYPNLLKIREFELLVRRGRVGRLGLRPSRYLGAGHEFAQLRDYVPDDEYRRISWKATARRGKPVTADYQVERSQNILILLDIGRQMMSYDAQSQLSRLDHIVNAILLFGHIASTQGDRMGLLTFAGDVVTYLPPRPGRRHFQSLLEALYNIEAQPEETDYTAVFRYARAQRLQRSLLVLFTEPGSSLSAQTLLTQLSATASHHLALCVTPTDTAVTQIAATLPTAIDQVYARAVAEQLLDERCLWLTTLNRRGILTLDVPANQITAATINRYLEIKERGRV